MAILLLVVPGLLIWLGILLMPSRPWTTDATMDAAEGAQISLSDVTVLIPARNEAKHICQTLRALIVQGAAPAIILVDDQSTDATAGLALQLHISKLTVIRGTALPPGWSGKLWALEQGLQQVKTNYVLLLDADITLAPHLLATLFAKMQHEKLQMVSLMASLRMHHLWERMLLPAFIFFFKLLYPFTLSNQSGSSIAAAAGGCILVDRRVLNEINAFESIKGALIDDCALAKKIKSNGHKLWTGLTHSVVSTRDYPQLGAIWCMVVRTAYHQLGYSIPLLLLLCTLVMVASFILPFVGLFSISTLAISMITFSLMMGVYIPTLQYYGLPLLFCFSFPVAGLLFLLMTWTSACRHYLGKGASWKGRRY